MGAVVALVDWEYLASGDVGPAGDDDSGGSASWVDHTVLAGLGMGHVMGDHCADGGVDPDHPKLGADSWLIVEPWLDARSDNSSRLAGVNRLTGLDRSSTNGSRLAGVVRLIGMG